MLLATAASLDGTGSAVVEVVATRAGSFLVGGQQQQFSARGTIRDSTDAAISVRWTATGGSIDAAGLYIAGEVGGSYTVVVGHLATDLENRVLVTVAGVREVAIGSSLRSDQHSAVTNLEIGSGAVVSRVGYYATGGRISSRGLYTAPDSAGSYRVSSTLVPAKRPALSAEASVIVIASVASATAWTGARAFPHQPSGYKRFAEHDFSTLPSRDNRAIAGSWSSWGLRPRLATDLSAPVSGPSVFEFTYPAGLKVGSSVAALQGWAYEGGQPIEYSEIYETGLFRVPASDFETPGPGMKLLGYWGVGQCGAKVPAQIYSFVNGNGSSTSPKSTWTLDLRQQNNVSRSMRPNRSSKRIRASVWNRYEIQMVLNDVDVPNGLLRFWLDNGDGMGLELTHEYTDVRYRTSAARSRDGIDSQCGFYGRRWDPVYGGRGGAPKSRSDRVWIDHVYISGVPK
jgi:hypothetical protein